MLAPSCILLAPVPEAAEDARPWIVIRKDKADPPLPGTYLWDVTTDAAVEFKLRKVDVGFVTPPLRYFWYFDVPVSPAVLDSFTACGGSLPSCKLQLCLKLNPSASEHSMVVVVSNGPLKAQPKGPYDFESGVVFDSVEWHIKKAGACQN